MSATTLIVGRCSAGLSRSQSAFIARPLSCRLARSASSRSSAAAVVCCADAGPAATVGLRLSSSADAHSPPFRSSILTTFNAVRARGVSSKAAQLCGSSTPAARSAGSPSGLLVATIAVHADSRTGWLSPRRLYATHEVPVTPPVMPLPPPQLTPPPPVHVRREVPIEEPRPPAAGRLTSWWRGLKPWQKMLVVLTAIFVTAYVAPVGFLIVFGLAGAGSAMVFFGGIFLVLAPLLLVLTVLYAILYEVGLTAPLFGMLPVPVLPLGLQKTMMDALDSDPTVAGTLGRPLKIESVEAYHEHNAVIGTKAERQVEIDARVCGSRACGVVRGAFRKVGLMNWQPIRVVTFVDPWDVAERHTQRQVPIQ